MPFATNKTPEQLAAENAQKCKTMVSRAAGLLAKVSKKRGVHPDIKSHLKEVVTDLEQVAIAVGNPQQ